LSPVPSEHLQRLRAGDEGAGAALCRHFLPAIRCLALAGTLDPEVADEVVTSTMSRLLERLPEVESPKRLMPLVEEVTREQIKGKLRETGGRYTQLAGLPAEMAARAKPGEPDLTEIFGELPPDRAAWMLLESTAFIPAHQEVLFLLRHMEGMDYEAIGELTGTSVDEVGKALAAARRLFERELVFHLKKLAAT
jgi:DNA-directed RNA polymerase specialized sigma24 family protein